LASGIPAQEWRNSAIFMLQARYRTAGAPKAENSVASKKKVENQKLTIPIAKMLEIESQ
jgi:hypothetical protein